MDLGLSSSETVLIQKERAREWKKEGEREKVETVFPVWKINHLGTEDLISFERELQDTYTHTHKH